MSEAKVIRFPLKDVNQKPHQPIEKEIVDSISINALPNITPIEKPLVTLSSDELEAIKKEAHLAGVKDGLSQAKTEEINRETEIEGKLNQLTFKIESLDQRLQENLKELSQQAASLSVQVSKKLMGEVSNIQEHRVFKFFEEVFDKVKSKSNITISLDPELEKTIAAKLAELIKNKNIKSQVVIVPDDKLTNGGCEIDWHHGKALLNQDLILSILENETHQKTPPVVTVGENQTLQNS